MIYLRGILIGFAFVAPIGMQNIYMFNNALSNKMSKALLYNFLVWFCDALFSFAAFYGIGALISANEIVKIIVMLIGGALTLASILFVLPNRLPLVQIQKNKRLNKL